MVYVLNSILPSLSLWKHSVFLKKKVCTYKYEYAYICDMTRL